MKRFVFLLTLICLSVSSAYADESTGAEVLEREKCYGISSAGQNDGLDEKINPASSTKDFQGNAWKFVTRGTCASIEVADGRKGSLSPLGRDLP